MQSLPPIYKAVESYNPEEALRLLPATKKEQINLRGRSDQTLLHSALHTACVLGLEIEHQEKFLKWLDFIKALLKHGADANLICHSYLLPIHEVVFETMSSSKARETIAELLLPHTDPSRINRKNICSQTVLHVAAELGWVNFIKSALKIGASANVLDDRLRSPLDYALENKNKEAVMALLPHTNQDELNSFYAEHFIDRSRQQVPEAFPLHDAAELNWTDVIKFALSLGEDPNRLHDGETALDDAIEAGHIEAVQALAPYTSMDLLNSPHCANNNPHMPTRMTPVQLAITKGHFAIALSLVQHGADPSIPDNRGRPTWFYINDRISNEKERNQFVQSLKIARAAYLSYRKRQPLLALRTHLLELDTPTEGISRPAQAATAFAPGAPHGGAGAASDSTGPGHH